jgi:hypothetical protein
MIVVTRDGLISVEGDGEIVEGEGENIFTNESLYLDRDISRRSYNVC